MALSRERPAIGRDRPRVTLFLAGGKMSRVASLCRNAQTGRPFNKARPLALIASLCVLGGGGCASTTYAYQAGDGRIRGAFEQPFHDMSVIRVNPPDVLIHAAEAPYALPGDGGCSAVFAEIAALDSVLGPDLDATGQPPPRSNTDVAALMSGAVGGIIGLPYRSIVRTLSGAENRERAVRDDILAGMVRRAFLKGVARANNCGTPLTSTPAANGAPVAEQSSLQPNATAPGSPESDITPPIAADANAPQPVASEPSHSHH
jgi:hypothetical protein